MRTTDSKHSYPVAPNCLNQQYWANQIGGLDRAWARDITNIPPAQGWLYLAVVLDLKSHRVIGWSMDETLEQNLVHDALQMVTSHRLALGQAAGELLFHCDQGYLYAGHRFQDQRSRARLTGRMDNAPVRVSLPPSKRSWCTRQNTQAESKPRPACSNTSKLTTIECESIRR